VSCADDDHNYASIFEHMRRHSRELLGRELQVDVTEYGFSTYNPWRKPSAMAGYAEPVQAAYMIRGLLLTFAARVANLYVYNIMDDGTDIFEQEENFGFITHTDAGHRRKPVYGAVQRLAGLLGMDYEYQHAPPVSLLCDPLPMKTNDDEWQQPVVEPHLRIISPQLHCFRTPKRNVAFFWRAGRMDGELNPPLGDLVFTTAPAAGSIRVLDIVNDATLAPEIVADSDGLTLKNLPVGGNPIAVTWPRIA
jgi:hypothetical protein